MVTETSSIQFNKLEKKSTDKKHFKNVTLLDQYSTTT